MTSVLLFFDVQHRGIAYHSSMRRRFYAFLYCTMIAAGLYLTVAWLTRPVGRGITLILGGLMIASGAYLLWWEFPANKQEP